jgi:hypothetical protein
MSSSLFREAAPEMFYPVYTSRLRIGQQEQTTLRLMPAMLFPELAKQSHHEVVRDLASAVMGETTFLHPDGEFITMRRCARDFAPGLFDISGSYKGQPLPPSESLRAKAADFLSDSLARLPLHERLFVVMEKRSGNFYTAPLGGFQEYRRRLAPLIEHAGSLWLAPTAMGFANIPISQMPKGNRSITAESIRLRRRR